MRIVMTLRDKQVPQWLANEPTTTGATKAPAMSCHFEAVWAGDTVNQAKSENGKLLGSNPPIAYLNVMFRDQATIDALVVGKQYYMDISAVPDAQPITA